jgi:hypothetical protein
VTTIHSVNGEDLNHRIAGKIALVLGGAITVAGCANNAHVVATAPSAPATATVAVAGPSPAVAPPMVVPAYSPAPYDAYISVAVDADVVFVGGSTYVWYVGPDGRRHRQFYGHGDRRAEVFRRREALRAVMAHNHGLLPRGPVAASHRAVARTAHHAHAPLAQHAHAPVPQHGHAPVAHAQANRPHEPAKHASNERARLERRS